MVNSSLANAIFPDDWNSARVTPPLFDLCTTLVREQKELFKGK